MEVGDWHLETDTISSKLDLLLVDVQLENVVLKELKVLLERLVKWDLLEANVELEHVVKKVTRETLVLTRTYRFTR